MKKLFLVSASLFILPISVISCISSNEQKNQINSFNKKEKNYFYKNSSIETILNFFTNDNENEKNIYVFQQENKSDAKYNELKYAFVYDPIFITNSVHKNGDYNYLANKSKDVIKNALSNDWYWTLNNISHFKYIYNPYGDKYRAFDKEKEYFDQVKKDFGSLTINIKNINPTKLIKINYQDIDMLKNSNAYTDKESWYLIYDNNKAVKIWKFKENGVPKIQIMTDLLILNDSNNIEEQLQNLENLIYQKRLEEFNNEYEYAKGDAESEGETFNDESFLSDHNDEKYMEFQAIYQYNGHFTSALDEINKDGLNIYRFSMRFIDE
ncbi:MULTISPECIES: aromatic motif membrane protein [unclassified Mycoplasma]|uniref:aromatic motif membrane protein n=1 Tax=unclassified Mycoplasma TaxID=2683645 RepID=UPI00197C59DB|nr:MULTISPECIES: aromatic motif membrane protein [unclassified Mycoplasma]MBN4084315.1 hypothetical protein [Mycoplasma sp. CSL10166]MBU4692787.1 hypothetical protein [Mycoplasma sp. CSL7491-lung]